MKSIFDKSFSYVPADRTDVSKTFERVRAEIEERAQMLEESFWEWHQSLKENNDDLR